MNMRKSKSRTSSKATSFEMRHLNKALATGGAVVLVTILIIAVAAGLYLYYRNAQGTYYGSPSYSSTAPYGSTTGSYSSSSSSLSSSSSNPTAATTTTIATTSTASATASLSISTAGFKVSIPNGTSTNQNSPGYTPNTITVVIGVNNTVTWTNDDVAVHTVTANAVPPDAQAFDSGNINPGATFSQTFTAPGTYQYHCNYHTWMKGAIVVKSG